VPQANKGDDLIRIDALGHCRKAKRRSCKNAKPSKGMRIKL